MSESPKPGQVWRDRESGVEVTVRQIVGESATYVGEAVIGSCPLVDWDLHFEREVRAMSDNTERDKLAQIIARTFQGWNEDTTEPNIADPMLRAAAEAHWVKVNETCLSEGRRIAKAILAEFMPEHDREVVEKAFESFLSYRLLPDDVSEYVTEYVKAGRES